MYAKLNATNACNVQVWVVWSACLAHQCHTSSRSGFANLSCGLGVPGVARPLLGYVVGLTSACRVFGTSAYLFPIMLAASDMLMNVASRVARTYDVVS